MTLDSEQSAGSQHSANQSCKQAIDEVIINRQLTHSNWTIDGLPYVPSVVCFCSVSTKLFMRKLDSDGTVKQSGDQLILCETPRREFSHHHRNKQMFSLSRSKPIDVGGGHHELATTTTWAAWGANPQGRSKITYSSLIHTHIDRVVAASISYFLWCHQRGCGQIVGISGGVSQSIRCCHGEWFT